MKYNIGDLITTPENYIALITNKDGSDIELFWRKTSHGENYKIQMRFTDLDSYIVSGRLKHYPVIKNG